MIAVFEPELDGPSVIVWEASEGTRIIYSSLEQASTAYTWLLTVATAFHLSKQEQGVQSVEVFGEPRTSFEFVRKFLHGVRKFGYEVQEGLTRPSQEYW